jgi:hypothetical protein
MKRIAVYVTALLVMTLLYIGYSNNKDNPKTIVSPVISLKSTGVEMNPKYYENGFDFNYSVLPTLELVGNEDVLEISSLDDFSRKVVIGEDYYTYTENTGTSYTEKYELDKDENNTVSLPISRRGNVKDEQAIYYIVKDKARFVFRVLLPIGKADLVNETFEQTIEKKLNNISNPKSNEVSLSSNPYDYIKAEDGKEDYEYIVSQGEKSLNYMLNKFENCNSNGLQEYIMAIACSEILKEDTASKNWATGREWYGNYSKANK